MKRSEMKRGSGFRRALQPRPPRAPFVFPETPPEPRARMLSRDDVARIAVPLPKSEPARHERYRRLVALLPCMNCGIEGFSNACHGDEGKGLGIKSDDRTCWPGCVDRPGLVGCHSLVGASGLYTRNERRELEQRYARATRARIKELGLWPADLEWIEP